VFEGDLVKIQLQSGDIAHSFTLDSYRIARRVGAGGSTAFEFRAGKPGTFPFYCNLASDDGCRKMRGELVVRSRR
jgi:heme/copper-type cytochrome/quinol oxidase subunit 2